MVIQSLTPEDFQKRFVDDLQISDEPVRLAESIEEKDDNSNGDRIIVIAVRMEGSKLFVGYRAKPDIRINKCLVDDHPLDYTQIQQNEIVVVCNRPARYIRLSGEKAGSEILSNLCWVDHEKAVADHIPRQMVGRVNSEKEPRRVLGVGRLDRDNGRFQ